MRPFSSRHSLLASLLLTSQLVALAGCATTGRGGDIVVDMQGVDPVRYKSDLADCRNYADEVSIAEGAAKRGVGGAAVGAIIGAIFGGGQGAAKGAGAGGVGAAARGGLDGAERKQRVMVRCMSGRGYNVLG